MSKSVRESKYVVENLGQTIIHGKIPCSCIDISDKDNITVLVQQGLDGLASCETVCPHDNNFVIVKSETGAPFVEPIEDTRKSRIWIM